MKSKITTICTLFALIATTSNYGTELSFDLAVLNHQLIALNQNIASTPAQPVLPTAQPIPTLPREPMEQKTVVALQQFIDFNNPDLKANTRAFQNITLNHIINYVAPQLVPVRISDNALLIQLLTAWQDFPLQAFLASPEGLKDAKQTLEHVLDYRNATNIVKLFKFYSQFPADQQAAIKDQRRDIYLGGGDASCGYHAIKNLLFMTNLIFSQGATTRDYFTRVGLLLNLSLTNALFGLPIQFQTITNTRGMGVWRKAIIDKLAEQKAAGRGAGVLVSRDDGEWLTDEGLAWLFDAIKNNRLPTGLPPQQNSTVLNALQNENFIVEIYRGKNIPSQLKNIYAKNINFTGAYLVNTQVVGGSHWFTLMINKKDRQVQFIILDSKNRPNYSPGHPEHNGGQQVVDIINSLTTVDADDIQRAVAPPALKPEEQTEYKKNKEPILSEEVKVQLAEQAQREAAIRRDAEFARLLSTGMSFEVAQKALADQEKAEHKAKS